MTGHDRYVATASISETKKNRRQRFEKTTRGSYDDDKDPRIVIGDNGRNFTSTKFANFSSPIRSKVGVRKSYPKQKVGVRLILEDDKILCTKFSAEIK